MSRYHQSSNPFEDDVEDSDFVMVGKPRASPTPQQSTTKPSSAPTSTSSSSYNRPASSTRSAAGHQYPQRHNPYAAHSQSSSYGYHPDEDNPFEDRRQHLQRQIENSENTQLESTQRALASIYESETMGVATAEELVRQGETLDNIENKTDNMQQNLKTSQRHLNNIKSVFGGIKNWWSGDKPKQEVKKPAEESANTRLRATIEKTEKAEKGKPDVRGFYDEDDNDLDSRFMAGARKPGSGQYTMIQPVTRSAREEEVDYNLGMMSDGMSRLKVLAQGLGDEIERQNEQLDRINVKVENTDDLLTHQNRQMRGVLKK